MESASKGRNLLGIDGAVRVPVSRGASFYKQWLEFIKPVHSMRPAEMDCLAAILQYRFELSEKVLDDEILDSLVFGDHGRVVLRERLGLSVSNLNFTIGRLRKVGALDGNRINKKFIPSITKNQKKFKYLLYFDLIDEERKGNSGNSA